MKIQLIGAYTKIGHAIAEPIFKRIQTALELRGYEVHNPCEIVPEGTVWNKAMDITLENIPKMEAVYVINNWVFSRGSQLEIVKAVECCLTIFNKENPPPKIVKK
jgi:hypothetical protein